MDLGFADATAVVVGGGRGMGFATARCLADDGARVAVVGRTERCSTRRPRNCRAWAAPTPSAWWPTPPTPKRSNGVFDELAARWDGELNMLVNAAGPSAVGTFEDLTDDAVAAAVDEGVMGMVHCVRSALPLLRKAEWARIVNFSAHSTQRQSVILPAYTAAKAMVTSISKNLSLPLAKDEIMVNVVSPGSIASEALVGWAAVRGCRRQRPLRGDGRHRQALRAPGASAARRSARRDRSRRRVPGLAAQLLHDRCQHQRRRWQRLHLTEAAWQRHATRGTGRTPRLRGIGNSLYTPFSGDDGDDIDWDAYRTLVRYCVGELKHPMLWCTSGHRRVLVADASTSESACWRWRSRRGARSNPDVVVQACTAATAAKDCLELTQHAQEAGADIVYIQTPMMEAHGGEGVLNFFRYIADRTDIALGMFNSPSSGYVLTPAEGARIYAEIPAVCATKEGAFRPGEQSAAARARARA